MFSFLVCLAVAISPPELDSAYDADAFYVAPEQAANLGSLLQQHKVIRLASFDYSKHMNNITLSNGMRIYGLPGAVVPTVIIRPGSSHILLSNMRIAGSLYFPRSKQTTE